MYFINPELQRNIWLEMTLHRVIAAPLLLGAVLFLFSIGDHPARDISGAAALIYGVVVFLWGSHRAAEGVMEEVGAHTWDFQRLSPVSPWTLTLGKLFGSTVFVWYVGMLCLAAYAVAEWFRPEASPLYIVAHVALQIIFGVMTHALALLLGIQQVMRVRTAGRSRVVGIQIIALLMVLPFFLGANGWVADAMRGRPDVVSWYGFAIGEVTFAVVFGALFLGWFVIGAYRAMCEELKAPATPWAWALFMLFAMWFLAGLMPEERTAGRMYQLLHIRLIVPFAVALGFVYCLVLVEPKSIVDYRRLWFAWKQGNHRRVLELTPLWAVSFAVLLVMGLVLAVGVSTDDVVRALAYKPRPYYGAAPLEGLSVSDVSGHVPVAVLAFVLFAVRDIGVFHYFAFAPNARRADFTAAFYLSVLYILIPKMLKAVGLNSLLPVFTPFSYGGAAMQVIPVLLQAAAVWYLVLRRAERSALPPAAV